MSDPKPEDTLNRYFIRTAGESPEGIYRSTVEKGRPLVRALTSPDIAFASLPASEAALLRSRGAEVILSRRYEPVASMAAVYSPMAAHPRNQNDVMQHIRAPQAWTRSRGSDISIAIIDTGVCGTMAEFPSTKKNVTDSWNGVASWTDTIGHGTMTAAVAAATSSDGGRYDGVAPDATILACKTNFDETELFQIYEHLIGLIRAGKATRIVTNNSYGMYTCKPLGYAADHPMVQIIREAVSVGIVPVFAAGNNHVQVCENDPTACEPGTIWGINSLDEVITVGTVNEAERMDQTAQKPGNYSHCDSSRGPGELAQIFTKPDCVAPTYGEVVWGCGYRIMEWWGTSGAAPQVAGLAALLLSLDQSLTVAEVAERIRSTCRDVGLGKTCAGSGIIDCEMAVS